MFFDGKHKKKEEEGKTWQKLCFGGLHPTLALDKGFFSQKTPFFSFLMEKPGKPGKSGKTNEKQYEVDNGMLQPGGRGGYSNY